ncbi:phage tail tape measure protein [Paenibacillus polymyxa]|uniref:phage tail tape measure protein n=1 Tax=Paenibacillus polymyxa TaxID=1406 RepID=UPI0020246864|nr:phage tail tape measure protein [Paenibacillus polymyxa]URJ43969.1 phage tail tape measure protein [Paenibacillus polymyxa]
MSFDLIGHLRLRDEMSSKLSKAMGGMMKFGAAAGLLGSAVSAVAVAGDSVKKAMDFEEQMSTIKALTGSTDAQMKQMQQLALEQGMATKYSALESAKAIEELLKAGMSTAQVQAGGLNAALNLATAGGLELAEAAETMATSLNAFKKDGLTAAQAADILAGTANSGATDVRSLGYALASAGGVADMVGVSFKDFNTAIGLMSNDGLKSGSDAGTSYKSMLMYLQPQTKKATRLFEDLGIGVGKANKFFEKGKIKDLAGVADVLQQTLGKMSNQDRTATLLDMFGTDGVKAATTLYKAGSKGVKEFQRQMSNVTALQVAKEKMNNAAGAVEQLEGAIQTLQISALLPTMPMIAALANKGSELAIQLNNWLDSDQAKSWGNAIKSTFTSVMTVLAPVGQAVMNGVKSLLPTAQATWTALVNGVMNVVGIFKSYFPQISSALQSAWTFMQPVFTLVQSAVKAIGEVVVAVLPTVLDIFNTVFPIAAKLVGYLAQGITFLIDNVVRPMLPTLGEAFSAAWEVVKPILKFMEAAIDAVASAIEYAYKKWQEFKNSDAAQVLSGNFSLGMPEAFGGNGVIQVERPNANGHAGGLDRVPYNDYPARLHRDETVLTKHEASEWRDQQRGGGAGDVNIYLGGVTINNDSDIEVLCGRLVKALSR